MVEIYQYYLVVFFFCVQYPGFMLTRPKAILKPNAVTTPFTKSLSPMETPPVQIVIGHTALRSATAFFSDSKLFGKTRYIYYYAY